MNHPWPPNDAERADWDRRAAAYQARIDVLTAELAAAKASALTSDQARQAAEDKARAAEDESAAQSALAGRYRAVIEFYAGEIADNGKKAREAL
jgi:hypothetical protein